MSITSDLLASFKRATSLAFLRKMPQFPAEISTGALLVLMVLNSLTTVSSQILQAGESLRFNSFGLNSIFADWLALVVLILLLGFRASLPSPQRILADIASLGILFFAFSTGIYYAFTQLVVWLGFGEGLSELMRTGLLVVLWAWILTTLWWAGRSLWQNQLKFAGLRLLLIATAPMFLIPHQPIVYGFSTDWTRSDVWYWGEKAHSALFKNTADNKKRLPRIDVEATYYQQPALVSKALKGLKISNGQSPKFYFVGAAPDASQTVFKREVLAAQSMFDERFDTKGRSLVLINDRKSIDTIPMANTTNLALALNGVGKIMDVEKDVLVLFITTHGGTKQLSVRFPRFSPNNLSATRLATILKKSKIKNKVLIISACYSGSFIPTLKGDNTLIMTASHAERTSFGCSNERDWTYFGDALINRALKSTRSFTNAFLKARVMISAWEAKQEITPSEPQISVGELIGPKLDSLITEMEQLDRQEKPSPVDRGPSTRDQKQSRIKHVIQQPD